MIFSHSIAKTVKDREEPHFIFGFYVQKYIKTVYFNNQNSMVRALI